MVDAEEEREKTEVLARVERLRELIEEGEADEILDRAYQEIGRSLKKLKGRAPTEGESGTGEIGGQPPPSP